MGLMQMFRTNVGINDNQDPKLVENMLFAHSMLTYAREHREQPLCDALISAMSSYRAFIKNVYTRVLNLEGGNPSEYQAACLSKDPRKLIEAEIGLTADSPHAAKLRNDILRASNDLERSIHSSSQMGAPEAVHLRRALLTTMSGPQTR